MKSILPLFLVACFSILSLHAQKDILKAYEDHFENPRELVHVQLNKTKFYKGEMIGFKAYIVDKISKQPSNNTRNLYCVISDLENNAIKSSMLLVENGVAHSAMSIDSSFVPGKYMFKAYTNWMRNFDEPNYFSTVIEVSEFNTIIDNGASTAVAQPDIQLLPEGGHLLANAPNSLGIIAKDQFGKGLSDARAFLLDADNDTISNFKLDQFGIGKTLIIPELDDNYKLLVKYGDTYYETKVPEAEPIGISMRLLDKKDQLFVSMATNLKSLAIIKEQSFILAIHNGGDMVLQPFSFTDKKEVNLLLKNELLFKGINILTVFDQNNRPILERLYFNHNGIDKTYTGDALISRAQDSITLSLPLRNYSSQGFTSLSVSVLPEGSKSYAPEGDILSNLFLKPYIKGSIENAPYYFNEVGAKKQYQLNNLLLTQGWSSYDWKDIFSTPKLPVHKFEQGIDFRVSINNKKADSYLIEGTAQSNSILFDLPANENTFEGRGLYPSEGEKFAMTAVNKNGKVTKPGAYASFFPNKIPELNISPKTTVITDQSSTKSYETMGLEPIYKEEVTVLDEVTLKAKLKDQRQEKLRRQYTGLGEVQLVNDYDYTANLTFAQWIIRYGYETREDPGSPAPFTILQRRTRLAPLIYFDGVPLRNGNLNLLYQFNINNIDYIVLDRNGFSAPFGGQFGGVIRIKTKAGFTAAGNSQFKGMFIKDFPLSFTANKTFYVPKYIDYNTAFFRDYGVLAWEPELENNADGTVTLKFKDVYNANVNLYIEGVVDGQKFISEVKTISLN